MHFFERFMRMRAHKNPTNGIFKWSKTCNLQHSQHLKAAYAQMYTVIQ